MRKELQHNSDKISLQCSGLHKQFGHKIAVNRINLTIPAGSFYGLVGPNGAGKTTTLSMMTGLLRPDDGAVQVFGIDIWKEPARAKALIGVLPDGMSMPERLTGREVLLYIGLIHGLDEKTVATRAQELLETLGLAEDENTLVLNYSTGMRKKIALATALLHAPRLLVLDEPFEAIDPVSASTIKVILNRFVKGGGTVIFSSHVMATVEQLCDSLAVMSKGEIKADGSMDKVRAGQDLEKRFVTLVDGHTAGDKGMEWLATR